MAIDWTYPITGFGKGLTEGFLSAMQRRMDDKRHEQANQPIDFLSLLPPDARESLYPGQESLMVPPSMAGPMHTQTMQLYGQMNRTQPETHTMTLSQLAAIDQATRTGDWSQALEQYPDLAIPTADFNRVFGAPGQLASASGQMLDNVEQRTAMGFLDTPLTAQDAAMLGNPDYEGRTPRQLDIFRPIIDSIRAGERHEADVGRIIADTERTQVQTQSDALELALRERYAGADKDLEYQERWAELALKYADLDRYQQMTAPLVAKAVADASTASTEAQFATDTYENALQLFNAELEAQQIANQISAQDYAVAKELGPLMIQEAQEQVKALETANRISSMEADILERTGMERALVGLDRERIAALRERTGLQMDEAELSRYLQLTDPIVTKAVLDASQADLDLLFAQETYDTAVAQAQANLQAQLNENKISEQDYNLAVQLAPFQVEEAMQRVWSLELQNEARVLENLYATQSMGPKLQLLNNEVVMGHSQLQQLRQQVEVGEVQLAMARRLGPIQEEQAQAELDRTKAQVAEIEGRVRSMEQARDALNGLDPEDRDFALKLYQVEIEPYKGTGMWIPPFASYAENLLSGQSVDWHTYVSQYNDQMSQLLGQAPAGDESLFPWLSLEWQRAYKNASDSYYGMMPQFSIDSVPQFPSIEVWYGNYASDSPLTETQLIEAFNSGQVPAYIYESALGRSVSTSSLAGTQNSSVPTQGESVPSGASAAADYLEGRFGVGALEAIQTAPDAYRVAEAYGASLEEIIEELRRRE